jgi:hypothetical protein
MCEEGLGPELWRTVRQPLPKAHEPVKVCFNLRLTFSETLILFHYLKICFKNSNIKGKKHHDSTSR